MFWFAMCVLNILFPPLPVAIMRGISGSFIISVVLTILAWLPGVIFGFWCIAQDYVEKN